MTIKPRIYIHAPYRPDDPARALVKQSILDVLSTEGLAAQEFHVSGLPRGDAWTMSRAIEIMRQCDGALILALARRFERQKKGFFSPFRSQGAPIPSEYSHIEGALALSRGLPTLVVAESGMASRGILQQFDGNFVVNIDMKTHKSWIKTQSFMTVPATQEWVKTVKARYDVFLGYCSKKSELATLVKSTLESNNISVMDWAIHFRAGRTIFEEVQRAAASCRSGLFLFTADDAIEGSDMAMPRDNVLLEAGYFLSFAGPYRTLIAREKGAKLPADLGGLIYAAIGDRDDWGAAAGRISSIVRAQLEADAK